MNRLYLRIFFVLLISLSAQQGAFADVTIITPEEARMQAGVSLIRQVAFETPLVEEWVDATLGSEVLLWDPGSATRDPLPLMYDFDVIVNNEVAGRVSVAATPLLGTTRLSTVIGAREYDIETSLDEAVQMIPILYPNAQIHSVIPVVYQYPRVAAMIQFEDLDTFKLYKVFIELPTLEEIACWPMVNGNAPSSPRQQHSQSTMQPRLNPMGSLEPIGSTNNDAPGSSEVVSIYANLSQHALWDRITSYEEEFEVLTAAGDDLELVMQIDPTLNDPIPVWLWPEVEALFVELGWYQADQEILPTYMCKLIKQEEGDWCARAVAQMIQYYHFATLYHTQTQIDTFMNAYGWDTKWKYAMERYYEHKLWMTDSMFDPNIKTSTMNDDVKQLAGWNTLKKQIDDGFPLCDGVPVHARMCMAYNVYGHNAVMSKYDVGIYDPDMYNGGVRWETGWKDTSFGLGQVAQRYFLFIARY